MNSAPTTTREETALLRTSGGCPTTGRQVHRDQSTTADPRRCWTLARRRLRSRHTTPTRQRSVPQTQTPQRSRAGPTGKRLAETLQKASSAASGPSSHKLRRETVLPGETRNPPVTAAVNTLCPKGRTSDSSCRLHDEIDSNNCLYLRERTWSVSHTETERNASRSLVPWTSIYLGHVSR